LEGHEDWVRDLALTVTDDNHVLLASASQDHNIRLWKFSLLDDASALAKAMNGPFKFAFASHDLSDCRRRTVA